MQLGKNIEYITKRIPADPRVNKEEPSLRQQGMKMEKDEMIPWLTPSNYTPPHNWIDWMKELWSDREKKRDFFPRKVSNIIVHKKEVLTYGAGNFLEFLSAGYFCLVFIK